MLEETLRILSKSSGWCVGLAVGHVAPDVASRTGLQHDREMMGYAMVIPSTVATEGLKDKR